jgi:hypothetical protein
MQTLLLFEPTVQLTCSVDIDLHFLLHPCNICNAEPPPQFELGRTLIPRAVA